MRLLTLIIISLILAGPTIAQQRNPLEFKLIKHETDVRQDVSKALHFFDHKDAVVRFREVELNNRIRSLSGVMADDRIQFNLFPDTRFDARAQKVETYFDGNVTITAKLESYDHAFSIISTTEGRTLVTMHVPELGKRYQITSDPVTLIHYLIELDPALIPEEEVHHSPTIPEPAENGFNFQTRKEYEQKAPSSAPKADEVIDVMVLYTPAAETWANNYGGGILNRVATSVAIGNTVHDNSDTYATNRLVYTSDVSYTESGDVELDLDRLTYTSDGYMDDIHTWRDTYGADLVQLLTTMSGGIAWVLNNSSGSPAWGFSCAGIGTTTAFTPIHEMGHNMGCGHHKEQNYQPGPALFSYSAGWRWEGSDDVLYSSVMSYSDGSYFPPHYQSSTRVGYFSNPTVYYMGTPTGDYTDADNAWTVYLTRDEVADYRPTATINCMVCPGFNFEISPNSSWSTHSSSIDMFGCKMYRIEVEAGGTYTFQTGCGNGATSNFDTYLSLLDNNCSVLASNNNGCESTRSKITWTSTYDGYAYLKVRGYATSYGSYTLAHFRSYDLEWTGTVSNDWHNPENWNLTQVPTAVDNVEIPDGTPYECRVLNGSAECNNMTIESGGAVDIAGQNLYINGELVVYGHLNLSNTSSRVYLDGDVTWKSGSSADMELSATIDCEGSWYFDPGANVQLDGGFVNFSGPGSSYIVCKDEDCSFYRIRNYKTEILGLAVSTLSTADMFVDGNIYNYAGSVFNYFSGHDLYIDGFFNNMNGTYQFHDGTVFFTGNPTTALKPTPGSYFNNLTINTTSPLELLDEYHTSFYIHGDLNIIGGSFVPGAYGNFDVFVRGDWNNTVGTDGFVEDWSRVTFDGDLQYMQSDETFNLLEVDCDEKLMIGGHIVECAKYDWTSGGIDVSSGSFTALDLEDDGIFGGYAVGAEGEINLTNDGYVDLRGDVKVFGGTFNVSGTISWWPYNDDASLMMTGGIIDFKACGISIKDNAYDLDIDITGGKIKTVGNFINERADVDLSQVELELYGTGTHSLELAGNQTLLHLEVNKTETDFSSGIKPTDRNGNPLPESNKATTVNLTSDLQCDYVDLTSGSFYLNGHEMTVDHDFIVYEDGAFYMDDPADVLNVAETVSDWFEFKTGSVGLLSNGTVNLRGWIIPREGCSFTATVDNTINMYGENGGGLSNQEPTATYGNVAVVSSGSIKFLDGFATQPFIINGDLTIDPDNLFETQNNSLTLHGNFTNYPTSVMNIYPTFKSKGLNKYSTSSQKKPSEKKSRGGYFEMDNFLTINGTLDIGDGSVVAHDLFEVTGTGSMLIDGGSFVCDVPYEPSKAWTIIHGHFDMTDGLFEVTCNSPRFSNTSSSTVSGGIIRSGAGFMAETGADFNPDGGTLEMTGHIDGPILHCYPGNSLYNLYIGCPDGTTVHYFTDITLQGNLTIDSGNFECGYYDNDDQEFYIGADWTDDSGGFIPNEGTVFFYGDQKSEITTNETFYNLTIDKTNTTWDAVNLNSSLTCHVLNDFTTLDGAINLDDNTTFDVDGNVLLSNETGLNAWGNVGLEIFIGGNWNNENTIWDTGIGYSPGTEIITFDGSEDQILTTASVREDFGNLVIDKPSGEFRPNGTINVMEDLLIENGHWKDNTAGLTHYFEGDFQINENGAFISTGLSNTVTFKGTADQNVIYNTNTGYFYNITVDKTDWPEWPPKQVSRVSEAAVRSIPPDGKGRSQTVTLLTNIFMNFGEALTIEEGTLDLNGNEFRTWGDVMINDGGKIVADENATLIMENNYTLSVNNGGEIDILGSPGNEATVTRIFDGFYGFEVNDGGTIRAENAIFEYIGTDWYGLNIKPGALIDPSYAFTNCTFQHGMSGVGGSSFLTIDNDQTLTITGANFPEATADCNVGKDVSTGHVTFIDYTGAFSGEMYEFDPFDRIDWYEDELSVSPPEQIVGPEAGTTTFNVTSNVDWTVSESVDWLSVDPMSGSNNGTLTVDYDENLSVTVRTGEITISGDGVDDVTVSVTQAPADPELTVSPPERNVNAAAGSTTFSIESNTSWWVTESVEWFTVDPASSSGNGTLTVYYDENFSTDPRSGAITITSDEKVLVTVFVNQAGADPVLGVSPPERNVESSAGTTTFSVTSNTEWGIAESVAWLSVNPMSGSGNGVLTVDYDENLSTDPRSGEITVTTDEKVSITVVVNQAGAEPVLSVSPPERNVGSPAGTTTFSVTSNTEWGIVESVAWLSVDPMSGSGNGILTVDYDENLSTDPRSGEITVTTDEKVSVTVVVNQAGADPVLGVSPPERNVGSPAGTTTFSVTSNTGWDVSETIGWLTVEPMSGSGNEILTVNYNENLSTDPRSGEISITTDSKVSVTVVVKQAGADPALTVTPPERNVGSPAGTTTFSVISNTGWNVSESVGWLSVEPMTGSGNGTLTVNYDENLSTDPRSGEITVTTGSKVSVTVVVNQAGAGPYLAIFPASAGVGPEAGNVTFNLTSNTSWDISESWAWLSVAPASGEGDALITVTYDQNVSGSVRTADISISDITGTLMETFELTQETWFVHSISLPEGWTGLSSYVMPADNDIENVTALISADLIFMQTMEGILYPEYAINTIGTWDAQSAYKIKTEDAVLLEITGNMESDQSFDLSANWNMVPVICNAPVDCESLFGGTDLQMVKEIAGMGVMWPEYGINTLGNMMPGKAYFARMAAPGEVSFPAYAKNAGAPVIPQQHIPEHPWNEFSMGPSSHVIAVLSDGMSGVMPGDVIGVFDEQGQCFGVAEITSLKENAVITACPDDPYTLVKDGFVAGDKMFLKLYRPTTNEVTTMEATFDQQQMHTNFFADEGISVISRMKAGALGTPGATSASVSLYPNPTEGWVKISGIAGYATIEVFNAAGLKILAKDCPSAGQARLDLSSCRSGVYQIRITGNTGTIIKKVIKQ